MSSDPGFDCRAGKDLTEIILKSNMQEGLPFLSKIMRNPSEKRRKKQAADIPPPSLPLPWQAFPAANAANAVSSAKSVQEQE